MRFEGVTFVEEAVKSMAKEEFIEKHMPVIWQDRKATDREKMLSDTYDTIIGEQKTKGKPKKKEE